MLLNAQSFSSLFHTAKCKPVGSRIAERLSEETTIRFPALNRLIGEISVLKTKAQTEHKR